MGQCREAASPLEKAESSRPLYFSVRRCCNSPPEIYHLKSSQQTRLAASDFQKRRGEKTTFGTFLFRQNQRSCRFLGAKLSFPSRKAIVSSGQSYRFLPENDRFAPSIFFISIQPPHIALIFNILKTRQEKRLQYPKAHNILHFNKCDIWNIFQSPSRRDFGAVF